MAIVTVGVALAGVITEAIIPCNSQGSFGARTGPRARRTHVRREAPACGELAAEPLAR